MLKQFSNIIETRPLLIVNIIIFITIGFSILIPSIRLRTNFYDFAPDDEKYIKEIQDFNGNYKKK